MQLPIKVNLVLPAAFGAGLAVTGYPTDGVLQETRAAKCSATPA